jgi:hypothetical protein
MVQKKTKKQSATKVDYYPNRVALVIATVAVSTLLVLGLIASL